MPKVKQEENPEVAEVMANMKDAKAIAERVFGTVSPDLVYEVHDRMLVVLENDEEDVETFIGNLAASHQRSTAIFGGMNTPDLSLKFFDRAFLADLVEDEDDEDDDG